MKGSMIQAYTKAVPRLTTEQMIEVDRLMIEEYHIELIQMMENAGRCLAILAAERFLNREFTGKDIIVLAGTGGNGGGALVAARRLHNWGAQVQVFLSRAPEKMTPIPGHQLDILQRMGVPIAFGEALSKSLPADLIIDGIIGYSVKGDPYGTSAEMIHWANQHSAPTLSLDTPSGLDLTSGQIHHPTIQAEASLTLALPKHGLFETSAILHRGELYLGDISVPPALYKEAGLTIEVPDDLFAQADIVQIIG